jgi:hypothetical protein
MAKEILRGFDYWEGQTLGATVDGPAWQSECIYAPYIQNVVTGASSLNGSLKVQGTNFETTNNVPTNWVDITELAAKTLTTDGVTYWWLPTNMIPFKWLRLVYTRTGGSGSISTRISGTRI